MTPLELPLRRGCHAETARPILPAPRTGDRSPCKAESGSISAHGYDFDDTGMVYIPEEDAFEAFFALIFSHFSFAVNFGLFDLLTPLSIPFAIATSRADGEMIALITADRYNKLFQRHRESQVGRAS